MSQQAEQAILATLLTDQSKTHECPLEPEEFSSWHYQEIYRAIMARVSASQPYDPVTIMEDLEVSMPDQPVVQLVADLANNVLPSQSSMLEQYVQTVREKFRRKQVASIAQGMLDQIQEGAGSDVADHAISQLMSLDASGSQHDWSIQEVLHSSVATIEAAHEAEGLVGVNTGLSELNAATGGWHDTDLIVVGARPAMGKTALMLNFAYHADRPAGIISAEQGHDQVGLRLISIHGKLDSQRMRTADLQEDEWSQLSGAVQSLKQRNIRVNDEPGINITGVVRQAREWHYRYGMGCLFVDYAQKIRGSRKGMNRLEQVTEVIGSLKNLAKELGIPVIALAQVNREVNKRTNRRPSMGDLSDASEIEKEADMILMLYRDEVYDPETSDKGIAELDMAKNRHGPTGVIRTAFQGQFMRFEELAPKAYQNMAEVAR